MGHGTAVTASYMSCGVVWAPFATFGGFPAQNSTV